MKPFDVVATTEAVPEERLEIGQVGTVVEELDEATVLVEFSGTDGQCLALVPLPRAKLAHHGRQDLQSLLLHREAVALLRQDTSLTARLLATLDRWALRGDTNSRPLHERWRAIITNQDWDAALADAPEGQQIRQASPLPTLLPEETRVAVLRRVRAKNFCS